MSPVTVITLERPWRRRQLPRLAEPVLLGLGYGCYSLLRDLVPRRAAQADLHGWQVLHAERLVHLAVEAPLNTWLASRHLLGELSAYWYGIAHFVVTLALLVATRTLVQGRRLRLAWYGSTATALLMFWAFPTAPPRLLPDAGFTDVLALLPNPTTVSDPAVARLSNPYAALPSLHVAWAVWCAAVLWHLSSSSSRRCPLARRSARALLRVAAIGYPTTTTLVVLGTANHYLIDVAAGALIAALLLLLVLRGRHRAPVAQLAVRETSRLRHPRSLPPLERT